MSTMKKKSSRGFTLLELLIALTLSVIILGGVYTTFDSVINTKVATEDSYYKKNSLLLSARRVIKPDMLQMYDKTLAIQKKNPDNDELSFITNNSIKMEKAFPVKVRYYVEDTYLIREEKSDDHSYEWSLQLLKKMWTSSVCSLTTVIDSLMIMTQWTP